MRSLELFGAERLKNVLNIDKNDNPIKITNVLKSDLIYLFSNYMEISPEDLMLSISVSAGGGYKLRIEGDIRRLKVIGAFNTDSI